MRCLLRTEESSQNKKVKEGFLLVKNVFLNWNTVGHGTLSRDIEFPPKSFYFILVFKWKFRYAYDVLHPGLESFPITSKQWWCHCYIFRGLLCSVFQPGLWENGMACLVIQMCFEKSSACLLIQHDMNWSGESTALFPLLDLMVVTMKRICVWLGGWVEP